MLTTKNGVLLSLIKTSSSTFVRQESLKKRKEVKGDSEIDQCNRKSEKTFYSN
jgi:hypothetical protein